MLLKFVDQTDPANKEKFELAKLFLDDLKGNSTIFNDPNWLSEVQKIVDKVKATKSTAGKQLAEATKKAAEFAKEALDQEKIAADKAQDASTASNIITQTKKEILSSTDTTEMTTKLGILATKVGEISTIYGDVEKAANASIIAAKKARSEATTAGSTPEATKSANEAEQSAKNAEQSREDTEGTLTMAKNLLKSVENFVTKKKLEEANLLTDKNDIEKKANAILAEIQSILAVTNGDAKKAKDNITLVNGYERDAKTATTASGVTTYINQAQSTYDASLILLDNAKLVVTTAENKKTELGGLKKEFLPPGIQGTVNTTVSEVQGAVNSLESSIVKIKATLDRIVLIKTTKENEEEKERLRLEAEKKAKEEADKKAEVARLAKEKEEADRKAATGLQNAEAEKRAREEVEKRAKIQQFEKDVSSVLSNLAIVKLPVTKVQEATVRYNALTNDVVKDRIRESLTSSVSADNVKGLYMLQPYDE